MAIGGGNLMAGFYMLLSVFGILLGAFLAYRGFGGHGLGAAAVVAVGIFFTLKEILDIIQSGK